MPTLYDAFISYSRKDSECRGRPTHHLKCQSDDSKLKQTDLTLTNDHRSQ